MNQFELDEPTPCVIVNVNPRTEMHGEHNVPAIDVDLRLTASNDILSQFDPNLKSMLYERAEDDEPGQIEIEEVSSVSDMPKLRSIVLAPLGLTTEHVGCRFTVDRGLGGNSNLVMEGCTVKKFRAECKQGGSVELTFRVQATNVDERIIGRLAVMMGNTVDVMVEPPREQQEMAA